MQSVRESFTLLMAGIKPIKPSDAVSVTLTTDIDKTLQQLIGQILAKPVVAQLTMPQAAMSAMDGFAVRADDIATIPCTLPIVGASHAGAPHSKPLARGEAIKIFTGGLLPKNADAVVIVENTQTKNNQVIINEKPAKNNFVRPAGLDFKKGDELMAVGDVITARGLSLMVASGQKKITIKRKPIIGVLSTGDELQPIGKKLQPHQIHPTNSYSLCALITNSGGVAVDLGVARDNPSDLAKKLMRAKNCDAVVTTGGASVGEKDFVKEVIDNKKYKLRGRIDFWRIAMRPGKPIIVGNLHGGRTHFLGLPGNPASALITGLIFIPAMIKKLQGQMPRLLDDMAVTMPLAVAMPANGARQDYMRAKIVDGRVAPLATQDSSMLKFLYDSHGLIIRPINDAAKKPKDNVMFLPLQQFHLY
ncbi:MAG: molybdopterin molybdotransferase MoeA [Hydrotalea sp.]|nr:molybdopterin molybdotransferase MoeA [Hydrotalea sp.]